MNTLIIPDGFELVAFRWDDLPTFVRRAPRGFFTPTAPYAAPHVAACPPQTEYPAFEEEPERWDGLS